MSRNDARALTPIPVLAPSISPAVICSATDSNTVSVETAAPRRRRLIQRESDEVMEDVPIQRRRRLIQIDSDEEMEEPLLQRRRHHRLESPDVTSDDVFGKRLSIYVCLP